MTDKMMRISGRGEDGTAKAISTDNNGILKSISKIGLSKDFTNVVVPANSEILLDRVYSEYYHEFSVGLNAMGHTRINDLELRAHYRSNLGENSNYRFTANSTFLQLINVNSLLFYSDWHDVKGFATNVMLKNNSSVDLAFNVITLTTRIKGKESKKEIFGYSSEVKPDLTLTPKDTIFFEIDTGNVYVNDGTKWVVL